MEKSTNEPQSGLQTTDSAPPAQPQLPGLQLPTGMQINLGAVTHAGPIPAPHFMAGYGQIDPTFPNRIMVMAEENARSGRLTAERAQTLAFTERLTARGLAFTFATIALVLATYLGATGHDVLGGVIGGATMAGIAAALIKGPKI